MSTSIERVLNNPYLLADIMRHVAIVDKARNVLSTLCVSRAFRNPHVISEALRSITYIYKPLRDKVTGDSVMSCIDIDHVSGAVEWSELKIDGLLCDGIMYFRVSWDLTIRSYIYLISLFERKAPGLFNVRVDTRILNEPRWRRFDVRPWVHCIDAYTIQMDVKFDKTLDKTYKTIPCADFHKHLYECDTSTRHTSDCNIQ